MFDVWGSRGASAPMTTAAGQPAQDRALEVVAEGGEPPAPCFVFGVPEFKCGEHADDQRDRFGAGSQARLLEAAVQLGCERDAVADDERADAERAVEFVSGEAHRRRAERTEVDRHFADDLGRVGVQWDVVSVADCRQLGDRLEDAGFVVAQDGADGAGFGAEHRLKLGHAEDAGAVDAEAVDLPARRGRDVRRAP